MKRLSLCLAALVFLAAAANIGVGARRAGAAEKRPAQFKSITTAPANEASLTSMFMVNRDGDGEGEELPSSIMYFKKDSKEYGTYMTVTDLSLCRRPLEKKICQSFMKMIAGAPPPPGTEVTGTRIGGAGYVSAFLARVDSIALEGVDSQVAFLAGDSQDPPYGEIVLYIYAKKGTNLIQLAMPIGQLTAMPKPKESEEAYYKRFQVGEDMLEKAKAKGEALAGLFRLKP